MWIGLDISRAMLKVAADREVEGDVLHADMGHGFGFRSGTFDGAVSISALQWLCSAEQSCQNPWRRLNKFFASLYACLIKGGRCAFQFYPSSPQQVEMITSAAMKNGFIGGLIVDFPNSNKAKKYFLYLMAGFSKEIADEAAQAINMPAAREHGDDYSDSSEDESEDGNEEMGSGDGEGTEESGSDDGQGTLKKRRQDKIVNVGKRRDSKFIQKAKRK